LGYPKGGLIAYPKTLCEGIGSKGGTVLTSTGVKRVIVENEKVMGVETTDGAIYKSDIVVSNAGIKETILNLVGKEQFEKNYVKKIEGLKTSWSVYCLRLALVTRHLSSPLRTWKSLIVSYMKNKGFRMICSPTL
jgi:phytoene desaturase